MLKGYLIYLTKKNESIALIKTVEQPINKTDSLFIIHSYELNPKTMTAAQISIQYIKKHQVKQSE